MVWGAIGEALGGMMSGVSSGSSAKQQMDFQKKSARKSHQWEVQDLRAAGLNPILSSKYGGSPALSGAAWGIPKMDFAGASSSAATAKQTKAQTKNVPTQGRLLNSQIKLADQQANLTDANEALVAQNTHKTAYQKMTAGEQYKQQQALTRQINAASAFEVARYNNERKIENSKHGYTTRLADRYGGVGSIGGTAMGAARTIKQMFRK